MHPPHDDERLFAAFLTDYGPSAIAIAIVAATTTFGAAVLWVTTRCTVSIACASGFAFRCNNKI
jgi:hypothetical protein